LVKTHPEAFVDQAEDLGDASDLAVEEVRRPAGGRLTRAESQDFLDRQTSAEGAEDLVKLATVALGVLKLAGGVL